jgi:ankyrin repeat protein
MFPAMLKVNNKPYETTKLFFKYKINLKNYGTLYEVVSKRDSRLVKLMINKNLLVKRDEEINVSLRFAVEYGYVDMSKLLLDNGADIAIVSSVILCNIIDKGQYKLMKLLLTYSRKSQISHEINSKYIITYTYCHNRKIYELLTGKEYPTTYISKVFTSLSLIMW